MRPLMPPVQTPDNLFHDGNPLTGELGTIVDAEHLNNEQAAIRDTQSELIAILTAAAMEPASTAGQLLAALNKLYAPFNDTLGALSTLVGGANKLPYFTAADAAALTALSSIGRDIIGKATVADVLTYLGLRTAAKADVVGTVSQSGGVPTGAIIERGSNSNGEYTKFADGTLICWFTRSVESITSNPSGGTTNLYFSTESVFTFPATFVGTKPAVAPSAPLSSGGTSSWPSVRGSSLTGTSLALISNVQNAAAYLGYTAVGRWF